MKTVKIEEYIPRKRSANAAGDLNLTNLIITDRYVMQMFYWWQLRLLIEVDWVMPEDIWIKLEGVLGDLNPHFSIRAALTDFILTERK
jgi:hypothetical protein